MLFNVRPSLRQTLFLARKPFGLDMTGLHHCIAVQLLHLMLSLHKLDSSKEVIENICVSNTPHILFTFKSVATKVYSFVGEILFSVATP